jgi:hypothetical protein
MKPYKNKNKEAQMKNLKFTKISLDPNNRMLRVGAGLHDGKWFFRVDLWCAGYRITGAGEAQKTG